MADVEFLVLGPMRVRLGEREEELSGRLRRTLLGLLLVRANQPVPMDALADALWGEQADPPAARKLQLHVHRLRGLLDDPDRLSFDAAGYRLRVRSEEIDAERFDALVGDGIAAVEREPQRAIDTLRVALAMWRGVPFSDVDVPALADWARRLTERRLTAIESLHQAQLAVGLHAAVVRELTELVAEHPLRERLHGLLMTALYRAGHRTEALEVYRRARHTLVSELGLEPGQELRDLQHRVLTGDVPEPVVEPREVPAQLPVDVHGFVGREAEFAELDGLLAAEAPVVVSAVAGTAGVGKTALAVRWAHRVRDRFPDGQLYVDLRGYGPEEPVSAADALAGFLRALGLDGSAIPEDLAERAARFRSLIDRRRVLILMDNVRTVEQVRPLLPGGRSCFTLVTSRDSLAGLVAREGAHRIRLDRLPPADAVGLLRELLGVRVEDEPEAVDALVERCARLPLALRITAELVRSRPGRTVGELADELGDQQDTLDLLDVDGDPQTAVRAVFSWSYRRLDPASARVFRLLGPHPGHDMDAYALAAMAGARPKEIRRSLDVLVRAHLLDQTPDGRYQPHDLLRAYAAELAGSTDDTTTRAEAMTRLFDHYLATASAAMDVLAPHEAGRRPKVAAPESALPTFESYGSAFAWLDAERGSLLAMTQHAEPEHVVAMSDTVWRYLHIGGYRDDAMALHTHALHAARSIGDQAAEANARRVLASALFWRGSVSEALTHLERAMELYEAVGDLSLQAATSNNIGAVCQRRGDLVEAENRYRRAIALYDEVGDQRLRSPVVHNLAQLLSLLRRFDEARELYEHGLVIARKYGNRVNEATSLCGLAEMSAQLGQYRSALEDGRRATTLARAVNDRFLECEAMRAVGAAHLGLGEHDLAIRQLDSALRLARALGEADDVVAVLNGLAAAHAATGHPTEAITLYREAMATVEYSYREERAHAATGLGDVHAGLGEHDQAREHWHQALAIYRELGLPHADDLVTRLETAR